MRFFLLRPLQAAFLSALAGTNVAEAAARAAVTALSDVGYVASKNAGGDPNQQGINDQANLYMQSFSVPSQPNSDILFVGTQKPMMHRTMVNQLETSLKKLGPMRNLWLRKKSRRLKEPSKRL